MAVELVTGYQGKDHVTAEQWADFNRGIFGEAAILPVGNRMETAIQTANQITVKDGVAVFDGRQVYIAYGESENIAIQSGTQGMQRRDIVVLEYKRNEESGVESVQFKVINGTPAASGAKDPSVQDMDIRTGVTVSQKPFCRVRLNGTAIEGVDALVQVKEFKPHAFAAPVNNLAGTNPDLALAAPQGRELKKQVDALNSALTLVETELKSGDGNYFDSNTKSFCYKIMDSAYVLVINTGIIGGTIANGNNAIMLRNLPYTWKYDNRIPATLSTGEGILLFGKKGENVVRLGSEHRNIEVGTRICSNAIIPKNFINI